MVYGGEVYYRMRKGQRYREFLGGDGVLGDG